MRVYYFCPETGVYQGEDFQEQPDAVIGVTTVAPPMYNRGEVPVFDAVTQSWHIRKVARKGPFHREQA